MRNLRTVIAALALLVAVYFATSGSFLVLDRPQQGDVIVVLAGETQQRPTKGLQLLRQGYAPRMLLDVPAGATIYQWKQTELAQMYAHEQPEAGAVTICPIAGLSTKTEAKDIGRCLGSAEGSRLLVVTSDYHTRRALSVCEHELPQYSCSVAAAYDAEQFGTKWWQHRQWAKVNFDEWIRLVWWSLVDRWKQ